MSVYLSTQKVIKDWIDYNDHMNVSYYLLMFDKYGADTLNNIFKMGEHSAKTTKKSTMIVESHITYNQELQLNDEVDINCVYFDHDKKRLQYKMEMIHKEKKFLASTIEILALYVDLNERKVAEFEDEKVKIMDEFIEKNKSQFNKENLKFSINKYSKGSFKFMRFNANSEFPKKLDGFLKFNSDCLRFLITKSNNSLEEATPQINKDS